MKQLGHGAFGEKGAGLTARIVGKPAV